MSSNFNKNLEALMEAENKAEEIRKKTEKEIEKLKKQHVNNMEAIDMEQKNEIAEELIKMETNFDKNVKREIDKIIKDAEKEAKKIKETKIPNTLAKEIVSFLITKIKV